MEAGLLNERMDLSEFTKPEATDAALEPTYVKEPVVTDTNFNLSLQTLLKGQSGLLKRN